MVSLKMDLIILNLVLMPQIDTNTSHLVLMLKKKPVVDATTILFFLKSYFM